MERYDLSGYDGVLAFSASVKDAHERSGWGRRAWLWHEAADVRVFRPSLLAVPRRGDVVWIGNWCDGDRAAELRELLLDPVRDLGLAAKVFGVRYPRAVLAELNRRGIEHGGWLPNFRVPRTFAAYTLTVHVPRRQFVEALPGTPAIRIFEALACGIPLVSGRSEDSEGMFVPGEDYLLAESGQAMRAQMRALLLDGDARRELAHRARASILARHTCAHRVDELLAIAASLDTERSPGSRPNVSLGAFL
jgi:spore maturation protein CgeB